MGKLTRIGVFLLLGVFPGCADIHQQNVSAARQPGQQVTTTPERLFKEPACARPDRPFVKAESLEVLPEKIKPGGRVNYRLIYAMCPMHKYSEQLNAQVNRVLLYKGKEVARNLKSDFEIKAGRWTVDSFFTLPKESPLGVYALEVQVLLPNRQTEKLTRSFVVSDEFYLSGDE